MELQSENNTAHEKYTYLFLDFNGKVPLDVFDSKVFIQIANLQEKNPLVQINDSVFKGKYNYTIGTNLFFEEIEEAPSPNVFEQHAPIHLKHCVSEVKALNLKPVKVCMRKEALPNLVTKIDYNFNWDYKDLLERFEKGTLDIDDIAKKKCQDEIVTQKPTEDEPEEPKDKTEEHEDNTPNENNMDATLEISDEIDGRIKDENNPMESVVPKKVLESDYEKLKQVAMRPVKRAVYPELVDECEEKYKECFEYHNIERKVLMPCDAFRSEIVTDVDELTLSDCVDIERCILLGIIPPSTQFPRNLTEEEKAKIFTFENFENLSLAARYLVLTKHVDNLEHSVLSAPKEMSEEKDECGRTAQQTLEIYKKLCKALGNRIQEIRRLKLRL